MRTPQEKSQCVAWFKETKFNTQVQLSRLNQMREPPPIYGEHNLFPHCAHDEMPDVYACERWTDRQTCKAKRMDCATCSAGHFGSKCTEGESVLFCYQDEDSILEGSHVIICVNGLNGSWSDSLPQCEKSISCFLCFFLGFSWPGGKVSASGPEGSRLQTRFHRRTAV
ncbi:hypothetical protein AVEN_21719-1 [Araneus ventricosus]|uniref:Sushi domain-containing protein n=1 Tax=Araneus ventricosus TaxID=182803 RepID=A0A4Y2IZ91_ARAVE|nr:hypothetical protein AVEN_21719-1 [Araneus ventricosus]